MINYANLKQGRLCVFIVSKEKSKPLSKVLLYAEAHIEKSVSRASLRRLKVSASKSERTPWPSFITNSSPLKHLFATDSAIASAARDSLSELVDFELVASDNAAEHEPDDAGQKVFDNVIKHIVKDLRTEGFLDEGSPLAPRFKDEVHRVVERNVRLAGVIHSNAETETAQPGAVFSLGTLGTDHMGYASWDLTQLTANPLAPIDDEPKVDKPRDDTPAPPRFVAGPFVSSTSRPYMVSFKLYYNMARSNQVDVLSIAHVSRDAIVALIELPEKLARTSSLSLSSMQQPTLVDWRISPGSFAMVAPKLLGEGGCEAMLPSTFATHRFPVREIYRILDTNWFPVSAKLPVALAVEYEVSLKPIGHSLGEISYTLPLAPGESVRLAVVDWHRQDAAARGEDTKLTEGLLHDQTRDRTISELVNASMHEIQKGKSIMGGVAAGAGGAYSSGAYGAAGGLMASFGGASTSSEGTRQLSVDTMQAVADAVHQASNSVRELVSTVVVQSSQAESEVLETRTFSNFNRGHTMTIMYYEILRHYHVSVKLTRFYEAVLIPRTLLPWYPKPKTDETGTGNTPTTSETPSTAASSTTDPLSAKAVWDLTDENFVLGRRYILEPLLLDPTLKPGFDALNLIAIQRRRTNDLERPQPTNDGVIAFSRFRFRFLIEQPSDDEFWISVVFKDPSKAMLRLTKQGGLSDFNANQPEGTQIFDQKKDDYWAEAISDPVSGGAIKWDDIKEFQFQNTRSPDKQDSFNCTGCQIFGIPVEGGPEKDLRKTWQMIINTKDVANPAIIAIDPPLIHTSGPENPAKAVPLDAYHSARSLMEHIFSQKEYYNRILDLSVQPEAYAEAFEDMPVNGSPTGSKMYTQAQPTAIGVVGKYIAFPRLDQQKNMIFMNKALKPPLPIPQRMVSLPARGLFAEAKLGHCNVAEEIDDTRFWKWDEHPLPIEAPEIAPVQPVVPTFQVPEGTTPTAFPVPIVNIQQPPAAPDPTGITGALKAISTPDIFRDMSGIKEVQGMLKDLTEGAVKMAQTAASALAAQQKNTSDATQAQMNHEKDMAKIASDERTAAANRSTPEDAQRITKMADNLVAQGKMSQEDRNKIAKNQIESLPGSTKPAPPKLGPKPAPLLDPLRKRKMQITVSGYNGYPMGGMYEWHLSQEGSVVAEAFLENATQNSTILTEFIPNTDRPFFLLSFSGDVADPPNRGLQIRHPGLELDIPSESWEKHNFYSVQITPTTQPFKSKSKSVSELIKKFGVSIKGGVSGEEEEGVDAKVAHAKVKTSANVGGELNWTPGDEDITTEQEVEMELTYYDGGLKVKGIK